MTAEAEGLWTVWALLPWLLIYFIATRGAFYIGALLERGRWLTLVRQAAEIHDREQGMLRLLDDTIVLTEGGWAPLRRDLPPRTRPVPPPPPRGQA